MKNASGSKERQAKLQHKNFLSLTKHMEYAHCLANEKGTCAVP